MTPPPIASPSEPTPTWPQGALHDWESLRSELLFAFDAPAPPNALTTQGHREGDFSAWLIRSGSATVRAGGRRLKAGPGEWLICFHPEIEQTLSPGTRLLSLRILQDWPDGTMLFGPELLVKLEARHHPRLERLARPLVRLARGEALFGGTADPREAFLWKTKIDYRLYHRYRQHLSRWLTALAEALTATGARMNLPAGQDPRLIRACQILDATPAGAPFPERELSRESGLTLGHLNRLCVHAYGFTLRGYRERRRLQLARQHLEMPHVPIKQIAFELGFTQLSHFSAWYRQRTGQSPRHYRQHLPASSPPRKRP